MIKLPSITGRTLLIMVGAAPCGCPYDAWITSG